MAAEIELEKCNFRNFRSPVTLTLNRVIRHTVVHHSSTSMYIPNFIEIGQTSCGWTYGCTFLLTDGHSPSNVIRSTQRSRPKNQFHRPVMPILRTDLGVWNYVRHFLQQEQRGFLVMFKLRQKCAHSDVPGNTVAQR